MGRSLPWLQDTADEDVSARWGAEHFDVMVLDADNVVVAVYNLRDHDLADPANYDELLATLRGVARE